MGTKDGQTQIMITSSAGRTARIARIGKEGAWAQAWRWLTTKEISLGVRCVDEDET